MLERAGLLRRSIVGRDHVLSLNAAPLAEAAGLDREIPPLLGRPPRRPGCYVTSKKRKTQMNAAIAIAAPPPSSSAAPSPRPPKTSSMPGSIRRRWPAGCAPAPSSSTVAQRRAARRRPLRNHHAGRLRSRSRTRACIASSTGRSAWCSPGSHRHTEHKETLVTVDFMRVGKRTEVVVTHEQLPESARAFASQRLDQRPRAPRRGLPARDCSSESSCRTSGSLRSNGCRLSPRDWCATCACAGRWRKPACPTTEKLHRRRREQNRRAHRAVQPFGQVPVYEEGDLTLFETGAIVLHIGERCPTLLPTGSRQARACAHLDVRGAEFRRAARAEPHHHRPVLPQRRVGEAAPARRRENGAAAARCRRRRSRQAATTWKASSRPATC